MDKMVLTKNDKSNSRNKSRVRKLKKKHLWPSILAFFFYVMILVAIFSVCVTKLLVDTVETKFKEAQIESEYVGKLYETKVSSTDNANEALAYIVEHNKKYENIALLGEDNTVIESYGDITADLHNVIPVNLKSELKFYYDKIGDHNWISKDGTLHVSFKKIFKAIWVDNSKDEESWLKQPVYTASFWTNVMLENKEQSLLVQCKFVMVREDLLNEFALTGMFFILLLLLSLALVIKIISRIRLRYQMYQLFYYDAITKEKNWIYYLHYTEKLLTSRWQAAKTYAIIDLQLERYRSFCSCYGVNAGEDLLLMINHIINQEIGKKELCVRYAKSNFALLLSCKDEAECKSKIEDLISKVTMATKQKHLSFHSGIYMMYPIEKNAPGRFYRRINVDIPQSYMYASEARASIEENEENAIAVFDQKMINEQLWVNWVENSMEKAMENEEFAVFLQPKYDPINNLLVGAEALVRWISPEKGLITPYKFIPIFENNGFIMKLDDYMVSHVARLQSEWIKEGKKVVPISVNISRAHFTTTNLAEHLCSLVDIYQTPHEVIEIELTESAFFEDKKVLLNTIKKIKEYGFEISMDDFGAGYSSLNTLKDLPLDILKIDADFFRGEDQDKRGDIIVGETIKLAKCLNMRTVAEGIETKEQVDFLADKGCDMIQGYYYAKPMPISDFEERAFQ